MTDAQIEQRLETAHSEAADVEQWFVGAPTHRDADARELDDRIEREAWVRARAMISNSEEREPGPDTRRSASRCNPIAAATKLHDDLGIFAQTQLGERHANTIRRRSALRGARGEQSGSWSCRTAEVDDRCRTECDRR